jgi:hypothetical protein
MGDTIKFTVQAEGANDTEELNMALKGAHVMANEVFERKPGSTGPVPTVSVQRAKD